MLDLIGSEVRNLMTGMNGIVTQQDGKTILVKYPGRETLAKYSLSPGEATFTKFLRISDAEIHELALREFTFSGYEAIELGENCYFRLPGLPWKNELNHTVSEEIVMQINERLAFLEQQRKEYERLAELQRIRELPTDDLLALIEARNSDLKNSMGSRMACDSLPGERAIAQECLFLLDIIKERIENTEISKARSIEILQRHNPIRAKCYRCVQEPERVFEIYKEYSGEKQAVLSAPFFISLAASFLDRDDIEHCEQSLNCALALNGGRRSGHYRLVENRMNRIKGKALLETLSLDTFPS